jgi:outer membrane protein
LSCLSRAAGAAAIALAATGAAFAQAPAQPRPAAPATARPAGPVPAGRIAIINISAFPEKVAELKRAIDALNSKFEGRTKELQALRDTIAGIETQVNQGTVAPGQQAQLQERYDQLKRDFQRKSEDLSAEAQKAYATSADPIRAKLTTALEKYAAEHGIVLVIEIGGAVNAGSVFYAAQNTNITDDFIAIYNKANP